MGRFAVGMAWGMALSMFVCLLFDIEIKGGQPTTWHWIASVGVFVAGEHLRVALAREERERSCR